MPRAAPLLLRWWTCNATGAGMFRCRDAVAVRVKAHVLWIGLVVWIDWVVRI